MNKSKLLAIVPAFNESQNISETIDALQSLNEDIDILVIDDGSTDQTANESKAKGVDVISLPFNLGIGGAVQTGFQYAVKFNYDIAVQVDGDNQHDVSYLKALCEPILDGQTDITIGSRFIKPYTGYRSSLIRRCGINFFAWLISSLLKCRITDPTSGFRAFNMKAIKIYSRSYSKDFPEPEAIVVASRAGLKITEVPVQMRKRKAGHSSIRYLMTLYYMTKVTLAILLNMIKRRPVSS